MTKLILSFTISLFVLSISAQTMVEGYVFESDNRGYLNLVEVVVKNATTQQLTTVFTDIDGRFEIALSPGQYSLTASKSLFFPYTTTLDVGSEKKFEQIKLERQPGYIFDVTMARLKDSLNAPTDAIKGAWVEIYNNTTKEEVLNLKDYPHPNFQFTFSKGNHYTVMIRKKGYFTKRLEAHVNVDGCILCFEGIGDLRPGVSENLTEGNDMGTLLANIELTPAKPGDKITLKNIYYDYNKSNIRPDAEVELNKLIPVLRDNPGIIVEISSHTDSRGDNKYNQELSFKRAKSAVEYIIAIGGIESRRILARGYGEVDPVNKCVDGIDCTDEEYQKNRRTELKVLGYLSNDPLSEKTLVRIKEEETMAKLLLEVQNQAIIEIKAEDTTDIEETKDDVESVVEQIEVVKDVKEIVEPTVKDPQQSQTIETEPKIERSSANSSFPKYVSDSYTGYKIQIMVARKAIIPGHQFFVDNPKVYIEKTSHGFTYLVGDFKTKDDATSHLDQVVKPSFPDAFIIHYIDGDRS